MSVNIEDKSQEIREIENSLLNHVVFPRCLPHTKPRYHHEKEIVRRLVDTVQSLTEWIPSKTVELFGRIGRTIECTPANISKEINNLRPGDTFGMFVRRQNTAILIYMRTDAERAQSNQTQDITVATYPGNLHPNKIYKYDSDIQVNSLNLPTQLPL